MVERKHPIELRLVPDGPYWSIAEKVYRKPSKLAPEGWSWNRIQWFADADAACVALVNRQAALGIEPTINPEVVTAAINDGVQAILAQLRLTYPDA